jgi:predicted kinase
VSDTVLKVLADLALPPGAWRRPLLIAITGLPCTGKTAIATYLAAHFPLTVLSTDAIRRIYGLPSGPSAHAVMYEVAAFLLRDNAGVIFDGIHLARRNRDEARAFARRHGAQVEMIYTTATEAVIAPRLQARRAAPAETAAAGKFVIAELSWSHCQADGPARRSQRSLPAQGYLVPVIPRVEDCEKIECVQKGGSHREMLLALHRATVRVLCVVLGKPRQAGEYIRGLRRLVVAVILNDEHADRARLQHDRLDRMQDLAIVPGAYPLSHTFPRMACAFAT